MSSQMQMWSALRAVRGISGRQCQHCTFHHASAPVVCTLPCIPPTIQRCLPHSFPSQCFSRQRACCAHRNPLQYILHQCTTKQFSTLSKPVHTARTCTDRPDGNGWRILSISSRRLSTDYVRDTFETILAESIEDEDMGVKNGDGAGNDEEEDHVFVSQSGKMLLFPWKRENSPSGSVVRDENRDGKKEKAKLPSVTAILQKTMSPDSAVALLRWESFMIKKMGLAAFHKLKREMFAEGHELHANIGHVLLNRPEEVDIGAGVKGYWNSIKDRLPELISESPVLECHVKHPFLGYHGYADCVTQYRGSSCLVEFKTSRKPKKELSKCFDNPLQVAAYVGAINFDPRYQGQISQALLVIAYKDGSPADLHLMTSDLCGAYWKKWLRRLQEYREMDGRQTSKDLENPTT